jgi:ABC-type lipoprotein release transport system permease subunit
MAGLALLFSAVGIFALVANVAAQKTREIGIRMALGSTAGQAMVKIGAPGARASALGLILGLILCAGTLRAMQRVLYGVEPYDVPTIFAVVMTCGRNFSCDNHSYPESCKDRSGAGAAR